MREAKTDGICSFSTISIYFVVLYTISTLRSSTFGYTVPWASRSYTSSDIQSLPWRIQHPVVLSLHSVILFRCTRVCNDFATPRLSYKILSTTIEETSWSNIVVWLYTLRYCQCLSSLENVHGCVVRLNVKAILFCYLYHLFKWHLWWGYHDID
jgi:hypothetical protein